MNYRGTIGFDTLPHESTTFISLSYPKASRSPMTCPTCPDRWSLKTFGEVSQTAERRGTRQLGAHGNWVGSLGAKKTDICGQLRKGRTGSKMICQTFFHHFLKLLHLGPQPRPIFHRRTSSESFYEVPVCLQSCCEEKSGWAMGEPKGRWELVGALWGPQNSLDW